MQTANTRPTLSNLIAFIILGVCLGLLAIMSLQTDFVIAQSPSITKNQSEPISTEIDSAIARR